MMNGNEVELIKEAVREEAEDLSKRYERSFNYCFEIVDYWKVEDDLFATLCYRKESTYFFRIISLNRIKEIILLCSDGLSTEEARAFMDNRPRERDILLNSFQSNKQRRVNLIRWCLNNLDCLEYIVVPKEFEFYLLRILKLLKVRNQRKISMPTSPRRAYYGYPSLFGSNTVAIGTGEVPRWDCVKYGFDLIRKVLN